MEFMRGKIRQFASTMIALEAILPLTPALSLEGEGGRFFLSRKGRGEINCTGFSR